MALDVGKIIDGLKLSYGQLRNLLITSIGAIATVWIVGNKVGGMTTKMDSFGATLDEIKQEMILTRTMTETKLDKIYTDFMKINETNNELWDSKFQLFIDYGEGNKELLKKLLEYEDKKAAAELQRINTDKDYSDTEKKTNDDPTYNGEVLFTPLDENGNPIDSSEIKREYSIGVKKDKNDDDQYEY